MDRTILDTWYNETKGQLATLIVGAYRHMPGIPALETKARQDRFVEIIARHKGNIVTAGMEVGWTKSYCLSRLPMVIAKNTDLSRRISEAMAETKRKPGE